MHDFTRQIAFPAIWAAIERHVSPIYATPTELRRSLQRAAIGYRTCGISAPVAGLESPDPMVVWAAQVTLSVMAEALGRLTHALVRRDDLVATWFAAPRWARLLTEQAVMLQHRGMAS